MLALLQVQGKSLKEDGIQGLVPHHDRFNVVAELVKDGVTWTRRRLPSRCKCLYLPPAGVQKLLDDAALSSEDSSDGEVIE